MRSSQEIPAAVETHFKKLITMKMIQFVSMKSHKFAVSPTEKSLKTPRGVLIEDGNDSGNVTMLSVKRMEEEHSVLGDNIVLTKSYRTDYNWCNSFMKLLRLHIHWLPHFERNINWFNTALIHFIVFREFRWMKHVVFWFPMIDHRLNYEKAIYHSVVT